MPHTAETAERRRAGAVDPGSFMVHARTIRAEYLAGLVRSVVAAITPGGRRGR